LLFDEFAQKAVYNCLHIISVVLAIVYVPYTCKGKSMLLCGHPNKPHYEFCPFVRLIVCPPF